MIPKDILVYSWISTLFSHHQRSVLLHLVETNTETHTQVITRVRDLGTSSLNSIPIPILSLQGSENPMEKEAERMLEPEGIEDNPHHQNKRPSKSTEQSSYEPTYWSSKHRSCPLGVWWSFQLILYGNPGNENEGFLIFVPSLGLFFFCWFAMLNFKVMVFALY